jgi:hypothetical protein
MVNLHVSSFGCAGYVKILPGRHTLSPLFALVSWEIVNRCPLHALGSTPL